MKIDFKRKFTSLGGGFLTDSETGKELDLGEVCIQALLSFDKNEVVSGLDKVKRYSLASAIHAGEKDSLTPEESVLLKELVGKFFTTIVVGQAFPMLDGE